MLIAFFQLTSPLPVILIEAVRIAVLLSPGETGHLKDRLVGVTEYEAEILRRYERTGRVPGGKDFVTRIENLVGCVLNPQKPGPKPKRKR